MRTRVYTASNEIDATITKGYLENEGIEASVSPSEEGMGPTYRTMRGPFVTHGVFVEEDKVKEALEALSRMTGEPKESN